MNVKELRDKNLKQLEEMLDQQRQELRDARFQASQNQLKNVRKVRVLKRDISKILTIINEKRT